MRGLRYFLVVVVAVGGLALAARLVYSRARIAEATPAGTPVANEPSAAPVTVVTAPQSPDSTISQPRTSPTATPVAPTRQVRSEEHTSELQSPCKLVCRP